MIQKKNQFGNEDGFVLVVSLLILLILVIIGVAATTNTSIELQIAGNEKVHKQTFYQADGGAELGIRLTYENAMCINMGGFAANPSGNLVVYDLTFANPGGSTLLPSDDDNYPDTDGDGLARQVVFYPGNASDSDPHTNMTVGGVTVLSEGSGSAQVSAYEGLGQASAAGGTHVLYSINSQHRGAVNSESNIGLGWRLSSHLINSASSSDCKCASAADCFD